jgi:hypothetical protein
VLIDPITAWDVAYGLISIYDGAHAPQPLFQHIDRGLVVPPFQGVTKELGVLACHQPK